MKKKNLKCYELRADLFDQLLIDFGAYVEIVPSTEPYITGYSDKQKIYYDGSEYLICKERYLNLYVDIEPVTDWCQCRLRRVENAQQDLTGTVSGTYAWNYMMKVLGKKYTEEEIKQAFSEHEAEYNEDYIQFHYLHQPQAGKIEKIINCYKYDINGAHTDALKEIFPKSAKEITDLYDKRHDNPHYKEFTNYFVGMIKRKGYEKTYNWIVQRTTKKLYDSMDKTKGWLIYANTDGYVVADPEKKLDPSKELGQFKLEYQGDVYVYQDKNYWLMQCGEEMRGSCLTSVRKDIDLRKGRVVHYDRKRIEVSEGCFVNVPDNVSMEDIK